jgi:hypothetical protein
LARNSIQSPKSALFITAAGDFEEEVNTQPHVLRLFEAFFSHLFESFLQVSHASTII